MVNQSTELAKTNLESKNEQPCTNKYGIVVSADIIRTAEIRMQQKGMLPGGQTLSHNPFWFIVETEKNVFLWRNGESLVDKEHYDFWVDIDSLLEKRMAQLERQAGDPISSLFSEFELNLDPVKAEKEYLMAFKDALLPILNHLSALSEVQREIISEHISSQSHRVMLPFSKSKS